MRHRAAIFASCTYEPLARRVATRIAVPLAQYQTTVFASTGELGVAVSSDAVPRVAIVIGAPRPRVHDGLMEHLLLVRALREAGADVLSILPYLPYSRSARRFEAGGPVAGRLIVDLLRQAGATSVVAVDLHESAYWNPESVLMIDTADLQQRIAHRWSTAATCAVAVDTGSASRADALAAALGLPFLVFEKERLADDSVRVRPVQDVRSPPAHAIIVDDALYSGASAAAVGAFLRSLGTRRIDLIVTHALATPEAERRLSGVVDRIAVTDTVPRDLWGIRPALVYSVSSSLASFLKSRWLS